MISFKLTFLFPFSDNQATGSTTAKATAPGARPKGSVIDLTEDDDDVQGKVLPFQQNTFICFATRNLIGIVLKLIL